MMLIFLVGELVCTFGPHRAKLKVVRLTLSAIILFLHLFYANNRLTLAGGLGCLLVLIGVDLVVWFDPSFFPDRIQLLTLIALYIIYILPAKIHLA